MNYLTSAFEAFLNFFTNLGGRHVIVTLDAPSRKLFDLERRTYGQTSEYFGLGLHLIVLPAHRQP